MTVAMAHDLALRGILVSGSQRKSCDATKKESIRPSSKGNKLVNKVASDCPA